ncbi:polysaccharide biosynthesis tyrosine autokinase [Trichothermofontia sichuanensis B231]|uniref:GumC family protein n=1 Tax=Trichothermofontia sichuanensis TaxID=3045816 RepID=UPI002245CFAE|nr:polysaccharide biosynthesis tyrosine autokinase [Trichothermofontia sichuanensis]UZQ55982.1 polysaccharide biosynthesis tyrosine autokinase [Trichothermofontia sichuanensis B231]
MTYSNPSLPEKNGIPQPPPNWPPPGTGGPLGPPIANDVDLTQILQALRRRILLLVSVAACVSAVVWYRGAQIVPQYEGQFRLLVEPVANEDPLPQILSEMTNGSVGRRDRLDYETQIQVLRSPEILGPILQTLQTQYPQVTYETLSQGLTIVRLQETKILEIRYRHPDPQQIKAVLDQLAQGYLRHSLLERQTSLSQGIQFVEAQIPLMQARVNRLQATLQTLRQQYALIDPSTKATELETQLSTLESQRLEVQLQLQAARQRLASLSQPETAIATLRSDSLYQNLLEQLRTVDGQIAAELARSRANSPPIRALQRQRANLLPQLYQEAERTLGGQLAVAAHEYQVLQSRQQTLLAVERRLRQQLEQLPVLFRFNTDLQRELTLATEGLTRLLAARERLLLDAAQREVPWQLLVTPEVPRRPVEPNIPRQLLLGAIAGLLAGGAAVFLAEKLDEAIQTLEDLQQITRVPLLGVIPFSDHLAQEQRLIHLEDLPTPPTTREPHRGLGRENGYRHYKLVPFLEAFRSLWMVISLLGNLSPIRSLVISSAAPAEGKSTVALNLAQAAAVMEKRILLVDADLRRPQLHRVLNLPNDQGLSTLLTTEAPPNEMVQSIPQEKNLFVLTAGPSPRDPSRLLGSRRMQDIVQTFERQFDVVIYDTPPLLGFSDAQVLAPYTSGLVVVMGLGKTKRSGLTRVISNLKTAQIPLIGMIANGVKRVAAAGYSYGGYYYRYYHRQPPSPEEHPPSMGAQ